MQVLNVQLLQAVIMEQTKSHYLKLISYNCRGFNSYKSSYIASLLSKCNFLLLQEHWLSDSQLSVLGNIDNNILYYGVSGSGNDSVLSGRPFGGCAILWRSDLHVNIHPIDIDSKCICAVSVSSENWKLVIVNVYTVSQKRAQL